MSLHDDLDELADICEHMKPVGQWPGAKAIRALREAAALARRVEGAAKIDMPSRIGPRADGARLVITAKAAERLGIDGRTCRLVLEAGQEVGDG